MNKCHIIILAAGTGSRFNGDKSKQYITLKDNKTMIEICYNNLFNISKILTQKFDTHFDFLFAINEKDDTIFNELFDNISYCYGGSTRTESSKLCLEYINDKYHDKPKYVLIHDVARPFVMHNIIENIISSLINGCAGVIPAYKITDTVVRANNNEIMDIIDRDSLLIVQTPQGFVFNDILKAYRNINSNILYTDDASVLMDSGIKVNIVDGDKRNYKITTIDDLDIII